MCHEKYVNFEPKAAVGIHPPDKAVVASATSEHVWTSSYCTRHAEYTTYASTVRRIGMEQRDLSYFPLRSNETHRAVSLSWEQGRSAKYTNASTGDTRRYECKAAMFDKRRCEYESSACEIPLHEVTTVDSLATQVLGIFAHASRPRSTPQHADSSPVEALG